MGAIGLPATAAHAPAAPSSPSGVVPAGACLEESATAGPSPRFRSFLRSAPLAAGGQAGSLQRGGRWWGGLWWDRAAAAWSLGSAPLCRPPPSRALLPPRRIPEGSAASARASSSARLLARSFPAGPRRTPPQWREEQLSSQTLQPPFLFSFPRTLTDRLGSLGWALRRGKTLGSPRWRLLPPPPCGGGQGSQLGGHRSG